MVLEGRTGRHHPVLLARLFVLELLTLHPFAEGNDIRTALPGISDPTIRLTLEALKTQG